MSVWHALQYATENLGGMSVAYTHAQMGGDRRQPRARKRSEEEEEW